MVESIAQYWTDAGIETRSKEVTSDEYRASQGANELDVHVWQKGSPESTLQSGISSFIVPFGGFFSLRNGMLWERYNLTDGAEGIEPPAWTKELEEAANRQKIRNC